ncbi:MAG: hypothetical protein LBJ61_01210 [Deltaproteobacteria bacterium]|jgi:hypothetical protein|nr:hypothetical protein [Deltaproteobacteria bacterium]
MNNLYNFYYQTADSQPLENIGQFYFGNVDHVQKIIKALKENHLFVYSESEPLQNVPQLPLPETLPPDQNLVLLNQVEFVDAPDDPYLLISGAAIDPDRKSKLSSVYVILNDLKFASYYGTENSFTTKIARRKVNLNAGFARAIPLRLLPNGTYSLKVRLLSADKTALYESPSLLTLIKDTNTINISNTFNY